MSLKSEEGSKLDPLAGELVQGGRSAEVHNSSGVKFSACPFDASKFAAPDQIECPRQLRLNSESSWYKVCQSPGRTKTDVIQQEKQRLEVLMASLKPDAYTADRDVWRTAVT